MSQKFQTLCAPKEAVMVALEKSIPDKNIRPMGGMPLAYWSINAAKKCDFIDKVVISTDSNKIKKILSPFADGRVKFHDRAPRRFDIGVKLFSLLIFLLGHVFICLKNLEFQ